MKKKKILILSLLGIALVITISYVIFLIINNKNNKDNNFISKSELESIVDNNYKLAYILKNDMSISNENIELNNKKFDLLDDDLMKEYSLKDINELIQNTIIEENKLTYINKLNDVENNNYIEYDDQLFIKKGKSICKIEKYNIDDIKYKKINDTEIKITYKGKKIKAKKVENKWYSDNLLFTCS